ncbi:FkbM family methyltransferase [Rufibacter tibetensis]|uniref:Methyltransferase FkbM domain-containing protein n=1 Tax=Rufibacter tibetensis TaxID=512763 RepID=A0A0P0CZ92_9BACT|nr:FkbM family methyltransferase [Rufibacter tibetensis]ALJ00807.1 hypothetical protein DC20_19735 [Rufibacter tibetensis]
MKLLFHYLNVYYLILTKKHGCSFSALLFAYTKIIVQAHLGKWKKKTVSPFLSMDLLGRRVFFRSYVFLANQFEEIFVLDCYRSKTPEEKQFIIDGGGHVGMAVLYFTLLYPNAKILSFEPDPASFQLLEKFILYNKLSQVTLVQAALSSVKGTLTFRTHSKPIGKLNAGLFNAGPETVSVDVPAVILSDYIDKPVDLLKLDIEGAEVQVIQELVESGKISFVNEIVVEYHPQINPDVGHFTNQLKNLKFVVKMTTSSALFDSPDYLISFTRKLEF